MNFGFIYLLKTYFRKHVKFNLFPIKTINLIIPAHQIKYKMETTECHQKTRKRSYQSPPSPPRCKAQLCDQIRLELILLKILIEFQVLLQTSPPLLPIMNSSSLSPCLPRILSAVKITVVWTSAHGENWTKYLVVKPASCWQLNQRKKLRKIPALDLFWVI